MEPADLYPGVVQLRVGVGALILQLCHGILTAGAADADLALLLAVEIDQDLTVDKVRRHLHRSCKSGLLIPGEETLDGTMLDRVRGEDREADCIADPVVSAKRRTASVYPAILDVGLDGVGLKIEVHILILLAHHIHMALEGDARPILIARCGALADQYVACVIHLALQTLLLGKVLQVGDHLLLLLGGARDTGDLVEVVEDLLRLLVDDFIAHSSIDSSWWFTFP